ncbi:type II toxin-antitoxin system RelE/ParE family toxin [Flavobacterium sp.]|uniref:type II toxin-antitoxin system RelE/ParE family toxin n=1 Tax=Flavobacterium sp. TaxID=239 RepID=UPI00260F2037|nr:type II toxin-antitoxin system RelE/ParE family toxin [Flavobacterium sp.]
MAYRILVSPRAQKEIENAIDYYALNSTVASRKFIASVATAYQILSEVPFFTVRYKDIRSFKIKYFPYSLYFVVYEERKVVRVLSCFHNKRNPDKRPKNG